MDINTLFSAFEAAITMLTNGRSSLATSESKLEAAKADVATKTDAITAAIPTVKSAGADLIAGIQAQIDAAVTPPAASK